MALRDANKLELKLLQLFRQKQPLVKSLQKILIDKGMFVLDFGMGTPPNTIFVEVNQNGIVNSLRLPRQLFPKFEQSHIVSNFKQKKQLEMMIAISAFYDLNFIRLLFATINQYSDDTATE